MKNESWSGRPGPVSVASCVERVRYYPERRPP